MKQNEWGADMSETIVKKQSRFSWLLAKLILYAEAAGYDVTMGECWRTPEQARANASSGRGISGSLHCDRLAADINLFKDGKYLRDTESYRILGEWWERQCEDCAWGGRFVDKNGNPRPDGNHFSLRYRGRA